MDITIQLEPTEQSADLHYRFSAPHWLACIILDVDSAAFLRLPNGIGYAVRPILLSVLYRLLELLTQQLRRVYTLKFRV